MTEYEYVYEQWDDPEEELRAAEIAALTRLSETLSRIAGNKEDEQ